MKLNSIFTSFHLSLDKRFNWEFIWVFGSYWGRHFQAFPLIWYLAQKSSKNNVFCKISSYAIKEPFTGKLDLQFGINDCDLFVYELLELLDCFALYLDKIMQKHVNQRPSYFSSAIAKYRKFGKHIKNFLWGLWEETYWILYQSLQRIRNIIKMK